MGVATNTRGKEGEGRKRKVQSMGKKSRAKRGAPARRKGHNYEREIARYLGDYGFPAERILEYQEGKGWDVVSSGGDSGCRVQAQAKRRARIAFLTEIEQSFMDAPKDQTLRFWSLKQDRGVNIAVLPLTDFLALIRWARLTGFWKFLERQEQTVREAKDEKGSD